MERCLSPKMPNTCCSTITPAQLFANEARQMEMGLTFTIEGCAKRNTNEIAILIVFAEISFR